MTPSFGGGTLEIRFDNSIVVQNGGPFPTEKKCQHLAILVRN